MNSLAEELQSYISINEKEIELLNDIIETKTYKKNQIIFTEGNISDKIYFVKKGCLRLFKNSDNGEENTVSFYTKGQLFTCALDSYTFNIPAIENYQAVEQSEVLVFTKSKIDILIKKVPKFEIIPRIATENELHVYQKTVNAFETKSIEDRYLDLLKTHEGLFNRVSQKYIASFLGVSLDTLNRIKSQIFSKNKLPEINWT